MEKDSNKIGNVIRIIDNRTIIVNVGHDVLEEGESIKVYENLDMIYDIDGTELGYFEHVKDTLKVIDVSEKYSVCQKKMRTAAPMSLALSPVLGKPVEVPLNVSSNDIKPLKDFDENIHIGDFVKKA